MKRRVHDRRVVAAFRHALRAPKQFALRGLVLFAMVLAALPAWAGAAEKYRCRYSNRVMTSCCCKSKRDAAEPADTSPEVRAPSCCDTLRQAAKSLSASMRDTTPLALEAKWAGALVPITTSAPPRLLKRGAQANVEARAGPAIFLRDCRLLT